MYEYPINKLFTAQEHLSGSAHLSFDHVCIFSMFLAFKRDADRSFKGCRLHCYRLCGLVIRVPGCRSRGPGSTPGATRFSEK
jgi:hypothetical protein